jgi:hypothetical protein
MALPSSALCAHLAQGPQPVAPQPADGVVCAIAGWATSVLEPTFGALKRSRMMSFTAPAHAADASVDISVVIPTDSNWSDILLI